MELDPTQVDAVNHAVNHQFAIITGGAGTGKTTIIKEIISQIKGDILLCAFAGKAAARVKEATGRYASTIHSMLGFKGTEFTVGDLHGKTVIVDEASMVDSDLMARIIERKPDRLILVGDQAQLPPVGKGQPFHDIIAHNPEVVANLTKCFRNKEAVFKAATSIRNGEMPQLSDKSESEQWDVIATPNPEKAQEAILEWVKQGFIDFDTDIILAPKNGDKDAPCTIIGLNEAIVNLVNPRTFEGEKWKVGDRVINTQNNPEKDVWNGTTGMIHSIDFDGKMFIKLDDPIVDQARSKGDKTVYTDLVLFDKDMVKELQLAYALTVHKSQGSQYKRVVFCCLTRDNFSLNRSLIYTAVTRTKEQCIVVGQPAALQRGIATVQQKQTVLQELAKGSL